MSTRFIYKALPTAALGIALSLLLAAPSTAIPTRSTTPGAILLDPPAAPSNCGTKTTRYRDHREGDYIASTVSWRDNSTTEDGFTLERWWRNESGVWVLATTFTMAADSRGLMFGGRLGPDYKFRVRAFNASGDSAWSNWAH